MSYDNPNKNIEDDIKVVKETINICKHYVEKKCKYGDKCKYNHIDNICSYYFFGKCKKGNECKFLHIYKDNSNNSNNSKSLKRLKKKNTECFIPSLSPRDMTVYIGNPKEDKYDKNISGRDVIIVPNLFCEENDLSIYNKLLEEIQNNKDKDLWKLWHGDSHLIADDHLNWKIKCPTFNMIIDKLKTYFDMGIKATRFNWYRDSNDWKPYHHDAAAIDPKKAKVQNFTVGVSFGLTRNASFEHATTKTTIDFPLTNGSVYCFAKDINIEWRHGIPQLLQFSELGRISIIAWGSIKLS